MGCTVNGCTRPNHARGLCGSHYQQWRSGRDPYAAAPRSVHAPDWSPPKALSPAWHSANVHRPRELARDRPCGLQACGGVAMHGSDLCEAHDHWRAAQARLKARGLA